MIVGNLFFIKSSNGLFHYGVDYLRECPQLIRKILIKPTLLAATRAALPGHDILVCSVWRMLWEACKATVRGDVIYAPTPHPLPGLSRQWVVVHDSFPFVAGFKGRLKRALLRWSLASSGCRVAHINQSEVASFVTDLGVSRQRTLFAPNKFPNMPGVLPAAARAPGARMTVALVGTESVKKNYAALFEAVMQAGAAAHLRFHIYGHRNAYLNQLEAQFPAVQMHLVSSDDCTMAEFLGGVHALASVARQEGFGRPIAGALLCGLPCLLLDCPVFREFFDPGAHFFVSEGPLVQALMQCTGGASLALPQYRAPGVALRAFGEAVRVLKADGMLTPP